MKTTSCGMVLALLAVSGCGPAEEEAQLLLSPDRSAFDGRVERVVVKIRAYTQGQLAGGGVVRLSAPVGRFIGGEEVVLTEGFATATYSCSPDEEAACAGTVRLSGEWQALRATTQVRITEIEAPAPVRWEVVPTRSLAPLLAVAVAGDGSAWAVGERGVVLQLVERQWRNVPSPVRSTLRAITFDAQGGPVIAGDEGVVLRLVDGLLQPFTFGQREAFTAVAVDAAGQVHLGSSDGTLFTWSGDGLEPRLGLRTPVLSMARQGDEVWATGAGVLAKASAGAWLNVPLPVAAQLRFVQAGREGLWLGGAREGTTKTTGVVVSGPAPTWQSSLLPEPVTGFAEVPGSDERFALTERALYRRLADGAWEPVELPLRATAMASRGRGDLVLLGPPGISLLRAP